MNEQLAAIKARRAAITPGVWSASWAWGKSGGVYNAWAEAPFTSGTCLEDVAPQAEADAVFIAAAPGDVDTLLAMVDALTGERDAALETLAQANAITLEANRLGEKSLALSTANTAKINQVLELVRTVTADRDALREQLQQAQRQLAGGKPEPTTEENGSAEFRVKRMDELYAQFGNNRDAWPQWAQDVFARLSAAQNEYEAKYC